MTLSSRFRVFQAFALALAGVLLAGCISQAVPPATPIAPRGTGAAATPSMASQQKIKLSSKLGIPAECIKPGDSDLSNGEPDDSYARVTTRWQQLDCRYQHSQGRALVVLLDGTSNNKQTSTNIWRLYDLALKAADQGQPVIPYYDQGVGNDKRSQVSGNLFGSGVSLNIRQAYRFLAQAYQPGDRIYLFGFSRGAFTARSLNGFIEFTGLLENDKLAPDWGNRLPAWTGLTHLHREVANLYDIYFSRDTGAAEFEPILRAHLQRYGREHGLTLRPVKVEAIGVFDTVPAIGLLRDEEPDDHRIGLYARRGYHAMALDEQREDFRLQRFYAALSPDQALREVWFPGVHGDVGGGYGAPALSGCPALPGLSAAEQSVGLEGTPLRWMLGNFSQDHIFATAPWPAECMNGRLHDEFLDSVGLKKRVYHLSGLIKRHPVAGDEVSSAALCRMHAKLILPHPLREPDGRYAPANLGTQPQRTFKIVPQPCVNAAITTTAPLPKGVTP